MPNPKPKEICSGGGIGMQHLDEFEGIIDHAENLLLLPKVDIFYDTPPS
jgi:hypothetical protein